MKERPPDPVDIYVGERLRARRVELGIGQTKIAKSIALTYQQFQKYEKGTNRVSASRLYHIAAILNVDPGWFFEGYIPNSKTAADAPTSPPTHWTLLWHEISTLPLEVQQNYIALGNSLAQNCAT